ncbi:MAG: hypothetical protein ACXWAC_01795 [Usitatibacter sp.]
MSRKPMLIAAMSVAVAAATFSTQAAAGDPVAGALIGGGIGAAVGGPPGAAVGAVIGTIIGAESHRPYGYYDRRYYGGGYAAPVYYGPAPVYYAPAPVYYAPGPVYYGPAAAIVYRSGPTYAYNTRYVRGYDHRVWRDGRRDRDDRRWR